MNGNKVKVYKKVLKGACYKFDGAEEYINERIEEICSHEKLSIEEVSYFVEGLCYCDLCILLKACVIRIKKSNILWLTYQYGKIFEKFKSNEKFVKIVNQVDVSKSTKVYKIGIVKLMNNYPKIINILGLTSL